MNKDFTDRAVADLNRVVYAETFETMTSETIYRFLKEQMQIITFGDFLRRYIYEKMNFDEPFGQVPDSRYEEVIRDSFSLNRAPHAFTPVRSRWSTIIKRWLTCDTVKRETVFVLGFGLRMSDEDVSMFLTKAIKEQDFRFSNPTETVFWYCYHYGLPYSEAVRLIESSAIKGGKHVLPDNWNELIVKWDENLSRVFNRGFWNGYYLGQRLGEWSHNYGSVAQEHKEYAAKTVGWFSKIGIGDFLCEAHELKRGDEILIIGPTTGVIELTLDEIQVDYKVVETVHKGERFTIPVSAKIRPSDKVYVIVKN